jgi:uncharacterized delta-60 repeat protein
MRYSNVFSRRPARLVRHFFRLALAFAYTTSLALAQTPGADDPSWSVPTTNFTTEDQTNWRDIVALPDGKLLAVGETHQSGGLRRPALFRFDRNGQPDATFGTNGVVNYAIPALLDDPGEWSASHVLVDAVGRIYLVGHYEDAEPFDHRSEGQAVLRLRADGTTDTSYGSGGYILLMIRGTGPGVTRAQQYFLETALPLGVVDAALQPDGKLLLLSHGLEVRGDFDAALLLIRLDANGLVDNSFGNAGAAVVPLGTRGSAEAVDVMDDGSIVVAGSTFDQNDNATVFSNYRAFVIKLTSQGILATGFGSGGWMYVAGADHAYSAADMALQQDNRIVVGGRRCAPDNRLDCEIMVWRLNTNGALDSEFGASGYSFVNPTGSNESLQALGMETNGYVVLSGTIYTPQENGIAQSGYEPLLARLTPDGELDSARTDVTSPDSYSAYSLTLSDGAFLLVSGGGAAPSPFSIRKFVLGPAPSSGSVSSQQQDTFSGFRVDARDMRGILVDTVRMMNAVGLHGYIYPQSTDLNAAADVFVVVATPRGWYMRNSASNFVSWSGRIAELTPAFTNVTLTATTPVAVYAGQLPWSGAYSLYLGYRRADRTDVIYTDEAALLEVTP